MKHTDQWRELKAVLLDSPQPSNYFTHMSPSRLNTLFPELAALENIEQDPIHHPEGNVWNHTMQVLDAAAVLRSRAEYPLGFMLAALCHDLGKITATKTENGRIRSIGHEQQGLPIAEAFVKRLSPDPELLRYVLNMVELHMLPNILSAQRSGIKSTCRMFDRSVSPEDLLLLAKADHCSRPNAAVYEETEIFLRERLSLFRERMSLPHVTESDLIAAGFTPGSDFTQALYYAHKLRLSGVEKDIALKQTLAYLRKLRN